MSQTPDIKKRLDELEQRVRLLERRLALRGLTVDRQEPAPEAPAPIEPQIQVPIVEVPAAPPLPAPVIEIPAVPPPPAPAIAPPRPRVIPAPPRPARSAFDVERTIGMRWFAAAGAVVVVIGVGLFLKLAYQRGWLNAIPPAGKCISGATFGLLLLGAGEFIRRRLGAIASVGASAAGLGALFASTYAAYGLYHLMPSGVAFALLAVVAAIGILVAAVGNLVSIAVLSIVAAYVNPLIIGDPTAGPLILPAYLLAVLCTGLALSAWRAYPFRPLRTLAWWGTLLYGTWWCRNQGLAHPSAALTFLGAVWCAIHAELAIAARFPALGAPASRFTGELIWNRARFLATSFSTTAWAGALGVAAVRHGVRIDDWVPPAALAGAAVALGIRLAGNLRILRDLPRTDSERLGAGLAMQAGALLMTAVALAFSGWLEVVAWFALGLAAVATGRWVRSRGLDAYGLIALAIASLRLVAYDSPIHTEQPWERDVGGIILTRWAILMGAGAGAWAIASRLIRPGRAEAWRGIGVGAVIVAMAHLNLGLIHENADAGSVCLVWLVLGLAGLVLSRTMSATALAAYGGVVLIGACARIIVAAPVTGAPFPVLLSAGGLVITRWTLLMAGAAAAWIVASRLVRSTNVPQVWRGATIGAVVVALTHLNLAFIHTSADAGSVCLVWLILGLVGLFLSRRMDATALSVYGLIVLVGASGRILMASPLTGGVSTILASDAGLVITRWSLLMLGSATAWFVGAVLFRDPRKSDAAAQGTPGLRSQAALVGIGVALVFVALLHPAVRISSVCYAWTALSILVVGTHSIFRRLALDIFGLCGLAAAGAAWIFAYPADWMKHASRLPLHPGLLCSFVLAAGACACLAWLRSSRNPARPTLVDATKAVIPAVLALLLSSTSLEVARVAGVVGSDPAARRAAVSIWWGIVGVGLIVAGFWRVRPLARHAGLALIAIATLKAVAFDLATVPQVWRVASFVGLGLLMLGVAVGYARVSARLTRAS